MNRMAATGARCAVAARALSLGWALAGLAGEAMAQVQPQPSPSDADLAADSAPANGVITYPISFFADFRPATAQDIVNRIPGFSYSKGDDVRGFGGAAGNVLIDGERPSSKAVSLDDALRRITVAQVARIDLIRGGAPGIDMQGQPVVVNVVRRVGADNVRAVEFMGKLYNDHGPGATLRGEATQRVGAVLLSGAFSVKNEKQQADSGDGNFIRRNGAGAVIARGPFDAQVENRTYNANASAEYKRAKDAFRLNIGGERTEFPRTETARLINLAGLRTTEQTVNDLTGDKAEIGGDYQRQLAFGLTGRLIGLHTYKASDLTSISSGRGPMSISTKATQGGESILRGSLRGLFYGLTVEAGGEAAFNTLDVASSLTVGGAPVRLPSANVRVEEQRGEAFLSAAVKPADDISIEAGVRIETSTIRQSGDVSKERTLTFPKPRLVLSYAPTASSQLRFRLERTVGQLNFEDFAASSDLASGVINVGNANLQPERAWVSEVAYEQRFWTRGALVLTATHSAVEQVADVVPIFTPTGAFDAPGNLGEGTKDELKANLSLPFDTLGWRGALLRANWVWRRTRVTDPTTGMERPFSYILPWEGTFAFSQDFPRWKSTFNIEGGPMGAIQRQYRTNETRFDGETASIKIYWQYRPTPEWQFHVQLENVLGRERRRERLIYAGPRSNGVVQVFEQRSAEMEPFVMFRIRKTL